MPEASHSPNPYSAPEADLKGPETPTSLEIAEAESIRRRYIGHEASIKSIGWLFDFAALLYGFSLIVAVAIQASQVWGGYELVVILMGGLFVVVLISMGRGFARLRVWARWAGVVMVGFSFAVSILVAGIGIFSSSRFGLTPILYLFGQSLIPGYILYLLLSRKGAYVFSEEYRRIVKETPHIKYRTSRILIGFLALILLFLIGGTVVFFTMR